jgi:hypothetical protein
VKRIDLVGKIFGRLTVIEYSHTKGNRPYWRCLCGCGKTTVVDRGHLKYGHTKSCGCLNREITSKRNRGNHYTLGNMRVGLDPKIHPETKDIYWAAGIYEGEGNCIQATRTQRVSISQKDIWILDKFRALFGGSVNKRKNNGSNLVKRPTGDLSCFCWVLTGVRARGFLMTIYSLLSPRRQEQVRKCLMWSK